MGNKISLLGSLPVKTNPGYSLAVCLEQLGVVILRTQETLKPSFLKRMMGGISKDHDRTVVAACSADLHAISRQIGKIQQAAFNSTDIKNSTKDDQKGRAIYGYCERLITLLLDWKSQASEFESNEFGADKKLLEKSKRILQIVENIEKSVLALVN